MSTKYKYKYKYKYVNVLVLKYKYKYKYILDPSPGCKGYYMNTQNNYYKQTRQINYILLYNQSIVRGLMKTNWNIILCLRLFRKPNY